MKRKYDTLDADWGLTVDATDENDVYNVPRSNITLLEEKFIYNVGNEIHFTTEINKITIQILIRLMSKLINKIVNEPAYRANSVKQYYGKITYIVDSPGGSVTSVLKFVDFVNLMKNRYPKIQFISVISGLVASAGTIMAIIADKKQMTKNAHAMVHELSTTR